jgi:uncharacterized protein (TIRG00374 family)
MGRVARTGKAAEGIGLKAAWRKFLPLGRILLVVGLSLGALILALRRVSWDEMRVAFALADWRWVLLALVCIAVNTALKALRWQYFCGQPGRPIPFGRYLGLLLAGQSLNWLYPVRLGDVLRAQGIGERGPGMTFALGTLVAEKTFDSFAYALLLLGLLATISLPEWLRVSVAGLIGLTLFLGAGVGVLAFTGQRVVPWLERWIIWLPQRIYRWLLQRIRSALDSLTILQSRRAFLVLILLTTLIWLTALLNNWLVFRALHLNLPWLAAPLLLAALQAGITLPSAPGSMGIFEYTCVLVLGLWQVSGSVAFGYGVLLHTLVMLPTMLLGLVYLWRWGLGVRRPV